MRYRVRDAPALLRTPVGRAQFSAGIHYRCWPLIARSATLYHRSLARRVRVVAVVGSLGKTTTARAVIAALGGNPDPFRDKNAFSAVPEALLMVPPWKRHAVIEIGIGAPGEMTEYARMIRPDVAVVTSVASEHNRSLRTLEVTRTEKAEIVRALTPAGLAVLNGDDPNVRWMAGETRARVVTFGLGENSDVRATDVRLDWPHGTCFTLHAGYGARAVRSRLIGRQLVYPILAAVAVAREEGIPLDRAVAALETLPPAPGRMQPVVLESGAIVLRDDYKSTLETVDAALDVLAEIPAKRRIVVLGDVSEPPGSQGPIYRRLGERLAGIATSAVVIGGCFQRYMAGARRAGLPRDAFAFAGRSVQQAAELVPHNLGPGDVVLVKGRDTQRMERVALALAGRTVRCELEVCNAPSHLRCERCSMLERGWDGRRIVR